MQKILTALLTLTFSTNAYAQEQLLQTAEQDATATLNQFFPVFCNGDIQQAINSVKKCYQETPDTDPNIQQCIIADKYVTMIARGHNEQSSKLGQPEKYDPNFIHHFQQRLGYYLIVAPRYKDYIPKQYLDRIGFADAQLQYKLQNEYPDKEESKNCIISDLYQGKIPRIGILN